MVLLWSVEKGSSLTAPNPPFCSRLALIKKGGVKLAISDTKINFHTSRINDQAINMIDKQQTVEVN